MTRQNQLFALGALLIIILLGLGGYLFLGKNHTKSQNIAGNPTTASENGNNTIQSSISDIFTSGQTKQCAFDVKSKKGGQTKGTVYVDGNKAYGTFTMTTRGKETKTNLIRNENTFYIWGGALPSGIKMTMNVNEMAAKMQGSGYSSPFNPDEKINYDCTNWNVDESKFTPPPNVKFMDASTMMPKTTGAPTTQTGSDPCATIADPTTKAACENAMMHR